MGKQNFLAGGFTGAVGSIYGIQKHGKIVARAKPFSKSPPSTLQSSSVRAFEALNRISAMMAKKAWTYLSLSDKEVLKHNAVASWLKPCIAEHAFEPARIASVIDADGSATISGLSVSQSLQKGSFNLSLSPSIVPGSGDVIIFLVFNQEGRVFTCEAGQNFVGNINFFGSFPTGFKITAMAFRSDAAGNLRIVHGFTQQTITVA